MEYHLLCRMGGKLENGIVQKSNEDNMKENTVKLNSEISIDLDVLMDTRLLIQANSGGGKSWSIRRLLEQTHGKVQQIVIDLEGEFSTLREKYDYILAGKDGDTPAESKHAAVLARKLLEHKVSAIIDLYELPQHERKHFVKLFLEAMVNAPKEMWHPVLIVIDEAHVFVPEKGESEAAGAVIDIATRGRKRGFCTVLATQRLSKLNKDASAECNNKLIGRSAQDIDMKRASEELGFTSKEQMLSLRNLESGEFYAFGPAISREVIKLKIGEVKTSHPKIGKRIGMTAPAPTEKIKSILKKIGDIPQEVQKEKDTISSLQEEIKNLKKLLVVKNGTLIEKKVVDEKAIEKAIKQRDAEWEKIAVQWSNVVRELYRRISNAEEQLDWHPVLPPMIVVQANKNTLYGPYAKTIEVSLKDGIKKYDTNAEIVNENIKNLQDRQVFDMVSPKIQGGALRMLKVLVSRYPVKLSKVQLGTFSKLKSSSGTFGTYISTLTSSGYIRKENDLYFATQEGIDYIGDAPNPPQTQDEVIEMWRNNLTGGAKRIFNVLVYEYPLSVSKERIGELTQLSPTSGTFGTYMSILRSNGLVEVQGSEVKLSDNIFV